MVLWCVLALLLVRGAGDVLAGDEPPPAASGSRAAAASWPDDEARAFAVDFTRAYLSYSPRQPDRYARGVLPFRVGGHASSVVPRFARSDSVNRNRKVHRDQEAKSASVGGLGSGSGGGP